MKPYYSIEELAKILNDPIDVVADGLIACGLVPIFDGKPADLSTWTCLRPAYTSDGARIICTDMRVEPDPSRVVVSSINFPQAWKDCIGVEDQEVQYLENNNASNYSTKWLEIMKAAISEFFDPRRNPDAKKDEVIAWINAKAVKAKLGESTSVASTIFTIIKPEHHNPKKERVEPQQDQ
jgi:hypothetical protein